MYEVFELCGVKDPCRIGQYHAGAITPRMYSPAVTSWDHDYLADLSVRPEEGYAQGYPDELLHQCYNPPLHCLNHTPARRTCRQPDGGMRAGDTDRLRDIHLAWARSQSHFACKWQPRCPSKTRAQQSDCMSDEKLEQGRTYHITDIFPKKNHLELATLRLPSVVQMGDEVLISCTGDAPARRHLMHGGLDIDLPFQEVGCKGVSSVASSGDFNLSSQAGRMLAQEGVGPDWVSNLARKDTSVDFCSFRDFAG